MKVLVLGTGPFAVPTFRELLRSDHTVLALITRPDKMAPGRKEAPPNPMRDAARGVQLPIYTPDRINSDAGRQILAEWSPDLLFVCDYGQILAAELLGLAPLGGINLHGSLLPKYRGAAPIQWALLEGEKETGVSVIHMTPRLDGGPILATRSLMIEPTEDASQLESRLAEVGVGAVFQAIDDLAAWDRVSPLGQIQDPALVSKARRLTKQDGEIRWDWRGERIGRHLRGMKPWPGSYTHLLRADRPPLRLIVDRVTVGLGTVPAALADAHPGTGIAAEGRLWVRCGGGDAICIDHLQPAGKKVMTDAEFLRGYGEVELNFGAIADGD